MPPTMKHIVAGLSLVLAVSGIRGPSTESTTAMVISRNNAMIHRRDITSWGGYALLVEVLPAPSGLISCENTKATGGWYCPKGTTCHGEPDENYYPVCCPGAADCSLLLWSLSACADTSWTLWRVGPTYSNGDRLCCTGDQTAVENKDKIQCLNNSLPIPTSIVLPKLKQITQTAAPPPGQTDPVTIGGGGDNGGQDTGGHDHGSDTDISSGSGSGSGSSNSGSPGPSSSTDSGSSGGLSQPATIAIAVLATIVGLSAIFIGWLLWERSRKRQQLELAAAQTGLPVPPRMTTSATAPGPGPQPQPVYISGPAPVPIPGPGAYNTARGGGGGIVTGPGTGTGTGSENIISTSSTTPSPGPSSNTFPEPVSGLIPPPPAYAPPHGHPHTQELHGQPAFASTPAPPTPGSDTVLLIHPHGQGQPNEHPELDGNARYQAPGSPRGRPMTGGATGHCGSFGEECT
ncbi:hypothetical protein V8F06_004784 [Rhypophila decipiens]